MNAVHCSREAGGSLLLWSRVPQRLELGGRADNKGQETCAPTGEWCSVVRVALLNCVNASGGDERIGMVVPLTDEVFICGGA